MAINLTTFPDTIKVTLGNKWNGALGNRLGGPGSGGIDSNGEDNGVIILHQVPGATGSGVIYTEDGTNVANPATSGGNRIQIYMSFYNPGAAVRGQGLNVAGTGFAGPPAGVLNEDARTNYSFKDLFDSVGTLNNIATVDYDTQQAASWTGTGSTALTLPAWKTAVISTLEDATPTPTLVDKTTYVFK